MLQYVIKINFETRYRKKLILICGLGHRWRSRSDPPPPPSPGPRAPRPEDAFPADLSRGDRENGTTRAHLRCFCALAPSTFISQTPLSHINNTFLGCVRSPLHHHQGRERSRRGPRRQRFRGIPHPLQGRRWPGVPPLPLIKQTPPRLSFLFDSLDDAVEDAAKFLSCWLSVPIVVAHWLCRSCLLLAWQLWLCCCVAIRHDMLADRLGDAMNPVQNAIRRGFGYNEKVPRPDCGDPVAKFGYAKYYYR